MFKALEQMDSRKRLVIGTGPPVWILRAKGLKHWFHQDKAKCPRRHPRQKPPRWWAK